MIIFGSRHKFHGFEEFSSSFVLFFFESIMDFKQICKKNWYKGTRVSFLREIIVAANKK